jgi:hypothetical protein
VDKRGIKRQKTEDGRGREAVAHRHCGRMIFNNDDREGERS